LTKELPDNGSLKIFYGWWVTLALLVIISVTHGIGYYVFPIILKPLTLQFGWDRSEVSWPISIFSVAVGILGPMVGRLCDRQGAKKVMLEALPFFVAGLLLFSMIQSLWHLYAAYTLISIGVAGIHTVSVSSTINKWFSKKQGTATGIAFAGISVGGLTQAPLAGHLITEYGWRSTYVVLAILSIVIIIPLLLLLVKNRPEDMGVQPDGEASLDINPPKVQESVIEASLQAGIGAVFRIPVFWMATLSFTLVNIAFIGVLSHQPAFQTDMGISPAKAANALGYIAGFGIFGKVGAGWLGDRISKILVGILFFGTEGLSVIFLFAQRTSLLWPFVIIFGISMGANAVIRPLVVRELFGSALFGTIYGWSVFFSYFGLAVGAPFAGYVYDRSGSYQGAFIVFFLAYLAAVVMLLMSHRFRGRMSLTH
jgi:sugar phosphate permease